MPQFVGAAIDLFEPTLSEVHVDMDMKQFSTKLRESLGLALISLQRYFGQGGTRQQKMPIPSLNMVFSHSGGQKKENSGIYRVQSSVIVTSTSRAC